MAVGLSYEDPAVKLLNDGANIKVVYPKEELIQQTNKYLELMQIAQYAD